MDSPYLQSTAPIYRPRTNSSLSVHSSANPTGIRKRSVSRVRSTSTSQAEHLHRIVLDGSATPEFQPPLPPSSTSAQWFTPQASPQPQLFPDSGLVDTLPQWNVPTPPRSDSGVPSLSVDASEDSLSNCVSSAQDYTFQTNTTTAEMSSLGFLLPSQYGSGLYDSDSNSFPMSSSYSSMPSQSATSGPAPYGQTVSSSPALYQSRPVPSSDASRRHSEYPAVSNADTSYSSFRRISSPYESTPATDYTMSQAPTIPSIAGLTQSPLPSPHLGSNAPASLSQYSHSMSKSPSLYNTSSYGHSMTTAPSATQYRTSNQSLSYPPAFVASNANDVMAKANNEAQMKVLNQRPKPQCWEHGCNGRQFSTFSNLLRHQREKSGTATKSYCPRCGAEFTRTTARNGHLAHDKCQKTTRRASEDTDKTA